MKDLIQSAILYKFRFVILVVIAAVGVIVFFGSIMAFTSPPASEKKAKDYGITGSVLGVPYDLVMLIDMFQADAEKKPDIEDVNPVFTALEFGYIVERRQDYEYYTYDCGYVDTKTKKTVSRTCSSYHWVDKGTTNYTGKSEILGFIGKSESDELAAASVIPLIKQAAEDKSDDTTRFTADFYTTSDYVAVLEKFPIRQQEREVILDLYQEQYITQLYGDDVDPFPNSNGDGYYLLPVSVANVTSSYGYRTDPVTGEPGAFHQGTDFACKVGDPIFAADNGIVVVANKTGETGYGHHVIIDHGGTYTLYGHMTNVFIDLLDEIARGTQIGTCGSTGRSTGPHLHFEVQLEQMYGTRVDPTSYLFPSS